MSKFSIIFCFCLWSCTHDASCQDRELDSLKGVINSNNADTEKIKAFNWLSWRYYHNQEFDSAKFYAEMALEKSKTYSPAGYKFGLIGAYINFGNIYKDKGEYSDAIKNYLQALAIAEEEKRNSGIANASNNLGIVFYWQGEYAEALKYYFRSLKIKELMDNKPGIANTSRNIGLIYDELGNRDEALKAFTRALKINSEIKDTFNIAETEIDIATVYREQKRYQDGLDSDLKAVTLGERINNADIIALASADIGEIKLSMGKFDEAMEYLNKALVINAKKEDKTEIGSIYFNMAKVQLAEKNFNSSLEYFNKSLSVSKEIGDKKNIRDVYLNLVKLDSIEGNQLTEFSDYKNYIAYRDSITNEESVRKIENEKLTYDFERQQETEKAETDKKAARQRIVRNVFIGGFGFAFVFAGIFFFQRKRISKEKDRSDSLLLNILPSETAEELKTTGESKARNYPLTTVMFTDFKNFTRHTEGMTPEELVKEINFYYKEFDRIIARHNVEKIKTMGDGYMAAGGVPVSNNTNPSDTVAAALEIQDFMAKMKSERKKENRAFFEARIGIHSGPVVAGIVGIKKFAYDIWGDTVNIAARMESSGEEGKVNISGATYELVKDKFKCIHRGKILAKNKGEIDMYFVES